MWTILRKEWLELLRDRRTLMLMILMPAVIMPLIMGGFATFARKKAEQEEHRIFKYAVFNIASAPELDQRLKAMPKAERRDVASEQEVPQAIRDEKLDFAVIVPEGFEQGIQAGKPGSVVLEYNNATSVDVIGRRMRELVETYAKDVRQRHLASKGLDAAEQAFVRQPVSLTVKSTANERERIGELIGAILPYMLLIFSLQAAMASAMDMGAGEKERGTLESLLLLPVSRGKLVMAKFLAVASVGCMTSIIAVSSLAVWGVGLLKGSGMVALDQVISSITFGDFALIGLLILPANAIIAALLLSLSMYARSYKEAGAYGAQVMMILIVPIIVSLLPNMHLRSGWAWVPITNIALAVKDILKGTLAMSDLGVVMLSTVLVAGVLLKFCTEWCKREEVLFRT